MPANYADEVQCFWNDVLDTDEGTNGAAALVYVPLAISVYVMKSLQALIQCLHELQLPFSAQKLVEQRRPSLMLCPMQRESPVAYLHLAQAAGVDYHPSS